MGHTGKPAQPADVTSPSALRSILDSGLSSVGHDLSTDLERRDHVQSARKRRGLRADSSTLGLAWKQMQGLNVVHFHHGLPGSILHNAPWDHCNERTALTFVRYEGRCPCHSKQHADVMMADLVF